MVVQEVFVSYYFLKRRYIQSRFSDHGISVSQRWYNCQFKAQFSFKPCFLWPHLCCPRDINWPWVGRYQCSWNWNSNFWLLSFWNSWLQVVVEWKISLEELLGKHNKGSTCQEKKFHLRFTKFRKILPTHFSANKIQILWGTWKQMHFFNLWQGSRMRLGVTAKLEWIWK